MLLVPGDDYLGRGWDIVHGVVHPSTINEVVTTFSKARIHPKVYTFDTEDDITVVEVPASVTTISAKEKTTTSELTQSITVGVSVSGKIPSTPLNGEASVSVKNSVTKFSSTYSKAYFATADVSVRHIEFRRGRLSSQFLAEANALPMSNETNYKAAYFKFFAQWGTHYIREMTVGGRLVFTYFITSSDYKKSVESSVDVSSGVSMAMMGSCKVNVDVSSKDYKAVQTYNLDKNIFVFGGNTATGESPDLAVWQATVADAPVPIEVSVDTYAFLIGDPARRAVFQDMVAEYIVNSILADYTLELITTYSYQNTYNDPCSPTSPTGRKLGDSTSGGSQKLGPPFQAFVQQLQPSPEFATVSQADPTGADHPLLASPTSFTQEWNDAGSGGRMDGAFWNPQCPDGYNAVGSVVTGSHDMPPVSSATCVHSRCTVPCHPDKRVYSDEGSGAHIDGSLWTALDNDDAIATNVVRAKRGYDSPEGVFFCIRRKCVAAPKAKTPEVVAAARSYAETAPKALPSLSQNENEAQSHAAALKAAGLSLVAASCLTVF
eukprot:m51a1_g10568 hypothetical protein (548) ;mRNA; r:41198-43458